jgi:photosystem II stability/assembly factor-like uncharacterized protein
MRVILLIGTRKGAFVATSDPSRHEWNLRGPFLKGTEVNHLGWIPATRTLVASAKNAWWGPVVRLSSDLGETWREPGSEVRFAEGRGLSVDRIWFVKPDPRAPHRLYAGVDPGALFVSENGGEAWTEIESLTNHPTRGKWFPGGGGLMVHSIAFPLAHPSRIVTGISAAGAFRSDDGGATWAPKNNGVRADFLPDKFPEAGQCVHHLEAHPQAPDVLYQQNHCGVYRSDDGGDSWVDISEGLPSRFGFPLAVPPNQGDTLFVIPEEGSEARMTPGGAFGIYRSRDRGASWELLTGGLPQRNAYINVMRMATTTDANEPAGVYVGTQGGQIMGSRDTGDHWALLFNWLPPIYSVEAVTME